MIIVIVIVILLLLIIIIISRTIGMFTLTKSLSSLLLLFLLSMIYDYYAFLDCHDDDNSDDHAIDPLVILMWNGAEAPTWKTRSTPRSLGRPSEPRWILAIW